MARKKDVIHYITKYVKLFVLITVACAAVAKAMTYFAKATTVNKLSHRVGLSISQDEIHRKQSDVRWMKQQTIFERKENPRTEAENEIISQAEDELEKSKARHEDRVKRYEEQYSEKAQL